MNKFTNIAIVGLGQVGIYLYNELKNKSKDIEDKTGKRIKIVAISAKNKNKNKIIILSAIDNLIKGGAGQAVQNMNIRFNLNKNEGLK